MKKLIILLPVIAFLASCQESKYSDTLETPTDSISYVIGEALFRSFDNKGLNLKAENVHKGYIEARDSSAYIDYKETQLFIRRLELELEGREESFTATEQPRVDMDSIAYALGADLGYRFKTLGLAANPDALYNGIADYAENGAKGSRLAGPLYEDQYAKYQLLIKNAAEYRRTELALKNKAESDAFFMNIAKEEGVVALENGLMYKVLKSGRGAIPNVGDSVLVKYQGRFITGEVFDETKGDAKAGFLLQDGLILKGWLEALTRMSVGSKWTLYIPPSLAYGLRGFYDIEPNKALEFDVELLNIKSPIAQ